MAKNTLGTRKKTRNKRKYFMDLKQPDPLMYEKPSGMQESLEIRQISPGGIFCVGKHLWSKSYLLCDVNYTHKTFSEQFSFFSDWCRMLNAVDTRMKITFFNRHRDMSVIRDHILFPYKNDGFDDLREAYNDIMESKLFEGKNGIEQIKLLTITCKRKTYEEAKTNLATLETNFAANFSGIGSQLIPMRSAERLQILYNFFRPKEEEWYHLNLEEEILHGHDWRNVVVPGYLDFESSIDSFSTDRFAGACLYVDPRNYPTSLMDTFLSELSNTPFMSMFSVDYQPIPQDVAIKTLEEKLMGVEQEIDRQQAKRVRNKNFISDVSLKVRREKEELEKMLGDMRKNDQKMFWIGISMAITAPDAKQLAANVDTLRQIADKNMISIEPYYQKQREALNTILPLGCREVAMMRSMFTSSAGSLIPFNVQELQHKDHPSYYGVNQTSMEPILVNRKLLLNGNGFVFGIPGGGKSFTGCKMEMGSIILNTKDDIIVVDPTLEYFDVADAYGGTSINLTASSKQHMNPMEVDLEELYVNRDGTLIDRDGQVRAKSEFMQGVVDQAMEGGMKPAHKSLVDRSIRLLYTKIAQIERERRSQPVMSDFVAVLKEQKETEVQEIVLALEQFTEGGLNIFNHPSNVNVHDRVIVFGLRDLGESLSGVAMMVMLENITRRIIENAKRGVATWLYVDECHTLLGKKYSRDYLIKLWKKVRKLGGLCTGITQNVVEVLSDPMTSTLVSNSEYTCFLKLSEPDVVALKGAFPMISEEQLKFISMARPGFGLLRFGNIVIPFDNYIEKTNPVYAIYNTNLHEKISMKQKEQSNGQEGKRTDEI